MTPITQRFVTSAGTADRIKIVPANPAEQVIDGRFDVAVLKAFIQVLSPEAARCALKNISTAVAPGGIIYILGLAFSIIRAFPRPNLPHLTSSS